MQEILTPIIEIQEFDMKMIRLMRIKRERQKELKQIEDLRADLHAQVKEKKFEVEELSKQIAVYETRIEEISKRLKELEGRQTQIKKVEEFNALTQEMTSAERERITVEQKVSDLVDRKGIEKELLEKISESLKTSEESSIALEKEIQSSITMINEEGTRLKNGRDALATTADPDTLRIYDRLLRNKKDRVVVPIENRTCSGCHIALTAQHENIVRKGENLVFCEHCSRIHYWEEAEALEGTPVAPKRRRRRAATT
ncbi:MAG: Chromosome partition protein Smc [Chlamydiae bacterium]|nr:Chromosome partition protein Smc [Chlamydiota bacterium]